MIPEEAVEVAGRVVSTRFPRLDERAGQVLAREILEAASRHMMAAAWDEGYEKGLVGAVRIDSAPDANPYRKPTDAV